MSPHWLQRSCAGIARWRCRRRSPASRTFSLGIFKADRVGDLILAHEAIQNLARSVPAGDAALITSDIAADAAAELFPDLRRIVVTQRGIIRGLPAIWRSVATLAECRFDQLACLQHHRSATQELLLRAPAANRTTGCANARRDEGPAPAFPRSPDFGQTLEYPASPTHLPRELEAHRRVVEAICGSPISPSAMLPRICRPAPTGHHLLLSPFASHPMRDYGDAGIEAVLLAAQSGATLPVRLIGSPAQGRRLRAMAGRLRAAGVRDIAALDTPTFRSYADSVASARLVLTMETATAHLAVAMDKKTVVILGGGHFGLLGPWHRSDRQRWIHNQVPCYGCDWRCTQPEVLCITGIDPNRVARAVRELWETPAT